MKKIFGSVVVMGLWLILGGFAQAQENEQAQTLGIGGNGDARVRVAIGKIANERGFQVIPPWDDYKKARYIVHVHSFEVRSDVTKVGGSLPPLGGNNGSYSGYYDVVRGSLDRVTSTARVQVEGFGPQGWYLSSGYQKSGRIITSQGYTMGTYTANGSYSQQNQVETEAIERAVRNALVDLPGPVAFPAPTPTPPPTPVAPPQAEAPTPTTIRTAQPVYSYVAAAPAPPAAPPITVVVNPNGRKGLKVYGPVGARFWWKRWYFTRNNTNVKSGIVVIPGEGFMYLMVVKPVLIDIGAIAADGRQLPSRKENTGVLVHPGGEPNY